MPPSSEHYNFVERLTVPDAEAEYSVIIDGEPVAFGHCKKEWLSLLALMQDGDEIWRSSSPKSEWRRGSGTEFIVLLRDSTVVYQFLTKMS